MKQLSHTFCMILVLACMCFTVESRAQQTDETTEAAPSVDQRDSVINALSRQIQEMRLQEIVMQEIIEKSNLSAREDSLNHVRSQQRIDSLRSVTPGVPLVCDGDTLLLLYASRGGASPEQRVKEASDKIERLGKSLTFHTDSLYIFESELSSDIMAGEIVLLSISELDGMWQGKQRSQLAAEYLPIIRAQIETMNDTYGLRTKLIGVGLAILIIVLQVVVLRFTRRLFRRIRVRIGWAMRTWIRPFNVKGYELLNTRNSARILIIIANAVMWIVILLQLMISVPLIFSLFPETQDLTMRLVGYIWNPIKDIVMGIIHYVPNLIKIVIIIICFRYLLRAIRYFANEIAEGRIEFKGFYQDWAMPTFQILRALIWCFAVVMIWPLLPSSDSEVFKGVSVFVGLVFSLGSTAIVGNIISGIVITYMRPFKIGDFVKINGIEGEVIEKTAFVTRLRTTKNEIVTVPNSAIMQSEAVNYSSLTALQTGNSTVSTTTGQAFKRGVIIHTEVTIGYSVPRETVEQLLLDSVASCSTLQKKPAPFVRVKELEDFYVRYEINAYTLHSLQLSACYSELHKSILDHFFQAGVEIMSPHFRANRDGNPVEMPVQAAGAAPASD